jgi:hypothetical protein
MSEVVPHAVNACDVAVRGDDGDRGDEFDEDRALREEVGHLLLVGRHLGPGAAVEDGHGSIDKLESRARRVDGRVPSADYEYARAEEGRAAVREAFEHVESAEDALGLEARHAGEGRVHGETARDVDGIEPSTEKVAGWGGHTFAEADLDPEGGDALNIACESCLRDAERRSKARHSAGVALGFDDSDRNPGHGEEAGGSEAGGTGADDGYATVALGCAGKWRSSSFRREAL